jgi:hypothetical protein
MLAAFHLDKIVKTLLFLYMCGKQTRQYKCYTCPFSLSSSSFLYSGFSFTKLIKASLP